MSSKPRAAPDEDLMRRLSWPSRCRIQELNAGTHEPCVSKSGACYERVDRPFRRDVEIRFASSAKPFVKMVKHRRVTLIKSSQSQPKFLGGVPR